MGRLYRLAALALALVPGVFASAADTGTAPTPSATELLARVIADEAQVDSLQSLYLRFEGEWTTPPETIEHRLAKLKIARPDQPVDPARDCNLWPRIGEELEVAFDERRVRKLTHWHKLMRLLRVFDGQRGIEHNQYFLSGDEVYALQSSPQRLLQSGQLFNDLSWARAAPHRFWFFPTEPTAPNPPPRERPENYRLAGQSDFRGHRCYVLENGPARTRLHIGVDDQRLYGSAELYLPSNADNANSLPVFSKAAQREFASMVEFEFWALTRNEEQRSEYLARLEWEQFPLLRPLSQHFLADYRELAPGFWFPAQQGYTLYEPNDAGPDFPANREFHLVASKVNQPLDDSLFTTTLRDGVDVYDSTYNPPLSYKQKADRTPAEWQQIIDQSLRDETPGERGERLRAALIGKPAPEFSPSAWVNSKPLTLTALRGSPVVLHFWAMSSVPCRDDFPKAQVAHKNASKSGIVVIGLHTDGAEVRELNSFAEKNGMRYPIVIDRPAPDEDGFGLLFNRHSVGRLPFAALIDREGKIAAYGSLEEMLTAAGRLGPPVQTSGGKE